MADEPQQGEFVDRMFPAPTDHGIAQADRAVSTVRSGTEHDAGAGGERALVPGWWPEG